MNRKELLGELYRYRNNELEMKKYYEEHHDFCPLSMYRPDADNSVVTYEALPHTQTGTEENVLQAYYHTKVTVDDEQFLILNEDVFNIYESNVLISKHPRYSPPFLHAHAYFEILYVYDGSCLNTVEGKTLALSTGDLCIIPPNVVHALAAANDSIILNLLMRTSTFEQTFAVLYQSTGILADFFKTILYTRTYSKYLLFHTESDEMISDIILRMMLQQINRKPYYATIITGDLIRLCGLLLQEYEKNADVPENYRDSTSYIPGILGYLSANYAHATLTDTAQLFHLNSRYLSRLIKENTGKTFQTYITDIRMKEAAALLQESNLTIAKISDRTGYEDPTYFVKAFRKYYQCTPTEYRRENKAEKGESSVSSVSAD